MPRARLLIVEEALHTTRGHWYQYIKDILAGCESRDIHVDVLAHREAEKPILEDLGARPVIRASTWDHIYRSPNPLKRYLGVLKHNRILAEDVGSYLADYKGPPYDYYLAPTNLVHHVFAHRRLLRRFGKGRKFRKMVLIFPDAVGHYTDNFTRIRFPTNTLLLRLGLRSFAGPIQRGQAVFAAETELMAEHYRRFCGIEPIVLPHVVRIRDEVILNKRAKLPGERPPVFATFGFTRYDKGTDIFQKAIKRFFADHPEASVRFVIQWTGDFEIGGTPVQRDPELLDHPKVTYLDRFESSGQYEEQLARTDLIVLPYRRYFYYARLSRVAIDAAICGIPAIFPRQTWLERFFQRDGCGIGFEEENTDDLARAMSEALARLDRLREEALGSRLAVRSYYSPVHFVDALTEL